MILTASALLALTAFPGAGELPLEEPFGIWVRHLEAAGEGLTHRSCRPGFPSRHPGDSEAFRNTSPSGPPAFPIPAGRARLMGRGSGPSGIPGGRLLRKRRRNEAQGRGELAGGLTFDHQLSLWTGTGGTAAGWFFDLPHSPQRRTRTAPVSGLGWMDYTRRGFP